MFWWWRALLLRIYSTLRRLKTEHEIEEEFAFHLDMRTSEYTGAGLSRAEAQRNAEQRFGSLLRTSEAGREIRRGTAMDRFVQDLRYSVRALLQERGFGLMVALIMMLGIGANTAIFSVVYSVLLRPLPYPRPADLALIWSNLQKMGAPRAPATGAALQQIRDGCRVFQDVAGIWVGTGTFTGEQEPEQVKVALVSTNFFSVLGVKPALGRDFSPDDQSLGERPVILSYGIWRRRFGGDPNIIGQTVPAAEGSFRVAGILPANFALAFPPDSNVPSDIQAWTPFDKTVYSDSSTYYLRLLGRLTPGATIEQGQQEADSMARRLRDRFADYDNESLQLQVIQLHKDVVSEIKPALVALFFGAGLVLLICCFNVANLLLARANTRCREIALRVVLGASRWRVARQLLIESMLICCLGGGLGLGLGWAGLKLLMRMRPASLARVGTIDLDPTILAFVAAVSLGSGLLAGMAPVLETGRSNLIVTLREAGRASTGPVRNRMRRLLIAAEIALGFVLLIGAGLMVRSLVRLHNISPGFNPDHVLTFEVSPRGWQSVDRAAFVGDYEQRLLSLPGVEYVGAISHLPFDDYPNWYSPYGPEGFADDQKRSLLADYRAVTPGYFQAIGARLIEGRYFNSLDNKSGRNVVVVDDMLARQTWPDRSALGKRLDIEQYIDGSFAHAWAEVVGVVGHIKSHSLLRAVRGQIYIPYPQSSREHLSFVVRTAGDPAGLAGPVRFELNKLDSSLALSKLRLMQEYVTMAMAPTRFTAILAGIFAGLALVLATAGVYGVVSYSAAQRRHEIGVRMALGANSADILRVVLIEGLALAVFGLAGGAAASLALSGYLEALLFGVKPVDPPTYFAVAAAVALAALAACWRPAHKAASGRPMDALRQ
jgi:putative ABC transport system permease protein